MTHPKLPEKNPLVVSRAGACRMCPYWDERYDVCGDVGETFQDPDGKTQTIGCWCDLKSGRRILAKVCWADANGREFCGWKEMQP